MAPGTQLADVWMSTSRYTPTTTRHGRLMTLLLPEHGGSWSVIGGEEWPGRANSSMSNSSKKLEPCQKLTSRQLIVFFLPVAGYTKYRSTVINRVT